MNTKLISVACLLFILCSCKSLQPSFRNNTSTSSLPKKGNPKFLDDVSITPGEKKNHYTYNNSAQSNSKKYYNNIAPSTFNTENANALQLKYAVIMNVPVEQLNNLPLLQQIDHWWGTRYCLGGNNESCIDCSAFTQTMLLNVYGVNIPRTAHEQYDFSAHIKNDELQEGDLVFFKSGRNISHVGLYLGNNKFVHASVSSGVTISDLSDNYWNEKYAGGGRVLNYDFSAHQIK